MALSVDRGWSPERSKWSLLLGACQTFGVDAPDGRGLAGAVVLTRWGPDLASVGMMLVAARYGRRGLGRGLMEHVIAEAGDATVTLFATDLGRPLYEKLGFLRSAGACPSWARSGRAGGAATDPPGGRVHASGHGGGPAGDPRRRPRRLRRRPRPDRQPTARLRRPNRRASRRLRLADDPRHGEARTTARTPTTETTPSTAFAATRRPGGIPRPRPSSARWSPPTLRRPSGSSSTWPPTRTAPSASTSTPTAPNSPPGPTSTASSRSAARS